MKKQMKRLALYWFARAVIALCIAIGVPACSARVVDAAPAKPTCALTHTTAGKQLWHFEHAADEPGVPDMSTQCLDLTEGWPCYCTDLGDGWYECEAAACLIVPYDGTCPACP